jgi:hypothetical protein
MLSRFLSLSRVVLQYQSFELADPVEIGWARNALDHLEGAFHRPQHMLAAPARIRVTNFESALVKSR